MRYITDLGLQAFNIGVNSRERSNKFLHVLLQPSDNHDDDTDDAKKMLDSQDINASDDNFY